MPLQTELQQDRKDASSSYAAVRSYVLVFVSFTIAICSTAHILQTNLVGYVLLLSATLLGISLAGLMGVIVIGTKEPPLFVRKFLSCMPGWNRILQFFGSQRETIDFLEARHQTLTDNLAAAIIIRDAQGDILYCSPYIEVLTGYAQDEIYDDSIDFFSKIVHGDDLEKVERSLKVSQLGEAFQFRYRFFHKTGMLMWAETRTVPLLDEQEQLRALLSITFDVTGNMRYQHKVEEHNQDLKDFSYMLSHDLKSPMVTIRGMLTALNEDHGSELSTAARDLISHAERASKRLGTLVDSVIEYSRVSNLEERQQLVDCSAIVSEVVQELQLSLKRINGNVSITPLPVVWGDQTMLYQIFLNLLSNAIKYRSQERPLSITVTLHDDTSKRYSRICITDNGSGIPADRLEDIFRPFHRAHGKEIEGTGVGLACVKKLVERIGGSISVTSDIKTGSTFQLRLRRADDSHSLDSQE